jgi:hypothetical protein
MMLIDVLIAYTPIENQQESEMTEDNKKDILRGKVTLCPRFCLALMP